MKKLILALLTISISAAAILAQNPTGRLVGTVSGTDGVIPGAVITVTDNQTLKERTVTASGEGTFSVPQLEAGTYTVSITAPGFKTFTATDLKIDISREYSLNATLEVGGISETVTVTAGADILNATTAEISNTVSPQQVSDLPLNGRNPLAFIQLQAGVASNGQTATSINGQRPSGTNITLDGINVQDQYIRENASSFSPNAATVDTISEFTVTTSNAGAESGYGSSQVQQVTPRGQREFNGALFAYNRNDYFSANEFFNNAAGQPRPRLNRNQFGGRISGPFPLPRFGEGGSTLIRDKAFFFFVYEGLRQPIGSPRRRTILTPTARQGIFTYTRLDNGQLQTVNLLNGQFGVTGIDPTIQSRILANLPTTSNITGGDGRNTTGFQFNQRSDTTRDQISTRLDFDIDDRNSINGVFRRTRGDVLRPDFEDPSNNGFGNGFSTVPVFSNASDSDFFRLAYRLTPSANFSNEIIGGFFESRPQFLRNSEPPAFLLGLPLAISSPEVPDLNQGRTSTTYNVQDNAQYQIGNHSLRFGGLLQAIRIDSFAAFDTVPTLTLGTFAGAQITAAQFADRTIFPGGIPSTQQATANNLLALLGGLVTSASQDFNATQGGFASGDPERNKVAFENVGLYIADQWRVRPRLTLNLGVRYEIFTPLRNTNQSLLEVVIPPGATPIDALLNQNSTLDFIGNNAGGNRLFNTDLNNFAPNVSVAYSPQFKNRLLGGIFPDGGRTVIRGGYNLSYVNDEFARGSLAGTANTGLTASVTEEFEGDRRVSDGLPTITPPTLQVPRNFAETNDELGGFGFFRLINPNIQVPFAHQYNVGIQRELGFNTALEIRYVGGFSTNLTNAIDYNQIDLRNTGFLADFQIARANLFVNRNERARLLATGLTQAQVNAQLPQSAAFNATLAGSRPFQGTFNNLGTGFGSTIPGVLNLNGIINALSNNTPGALAQLYIQNDLLGGVQLQPNPSIGSGFYFDNSAKYNYNSLQVEVRRRFSQGLLFQGNYTFSKTLTNSGGLNQQRFEPRLDNSNPDLEYSRADYDQTHRFNFNSIYQLPFGRGKRFLSNANGLVDRLFGGFQFNTIVELGSGAPITITDNRGALNLAFFSRRNTPLTNLSRDELKNLFGVFERNGVKYFINPDVVDTLTGRGARGAIDQLTGQEITFPGQVFFLTPGGQVGNTPRAIGVGPMFFNVDASLIKNIRITEGSRLQLRVEAFNVFNRTNFDPNVLDSLSRPNQSFVDINSPTFGQIRNNFDPRVLQFAARFEF